MIPIQPGRRSASARSRPHKWCPAVRLRSDAAPVVRTVSDEPDSSAVRTALWRALHVRARRPAAPDRRRDRPRARRARGRTGATGRTCTRSAPAVPRRDRGPHPVRRGPGRRRGHRPVRTPRRRPRHVRATTSPSSPTGSRCSRSTSPGRRRGSGSAWRQLGYGVPEHAAPRSRWTSRPTTTGGRRCVDAGFDATARAARVVERCVDVHHQGRRRRRRSADSAAMAPGSVVVMTFMLPFELVDEADRRRSRGARRAARGPRAHRGSASTRRRRSWRWRKEAGFADVRYVSTAELAERYLAGRTDGLRAAAGEGVLVART